MPRQPAGFFFSPDHFADVLNVVPGRNWDKPVELLRMENRIAEFRKKKGWSQQALADKLGVKYQQVATWERGQNLPSLRWALLLARELETTVEELFPLDA